MKEYSEKVIEILYLHESLFGLGSFVKEINDLELS
jgi:hypothetical protein